MNAVCSHKFIHWQEFFWWLSSSGRWRRVALPEDDNHHSHRRGNLKSYKEFFYFLKILLMFVLLGFNPNLFSSESRNILWHDGWKPELWSEKRLPLLVNGSVNTLTRRRIRCNNIGTVAMRSLQRLQNEDTSQFSSESWVESRRLESAVSSCMLAAVT
jgi:hypothetical protein